eukprot:g23080.t1
MVYRAVLVPALLYGSETWTVYSRLLKVLEQYHLRCLRKILPIRWEDRRTNTSVLNQANIPSTEALTALDWLQWARHIVCMTDTRLPPALLPPLKQKVIASWTGELHPGYPRCLTGEVQHSHRHLGITGPRPSKLEEEHQEGVKHLKTCHW